MLSTQICFKFRVFNLEIRGTTASIDCFDLERTPQYIDCLKEMRYYNVISKNEIEEFFTIDKKMKTVIPNPRNLLDKYIHADLPTIIEFLKVIGLDVSGVIGAKSHMQEKRIMAESSL